MDSRSIFLTANNNTAYSWMWLDLRNGPLVVEVPPKVLGVIDDMWYHWVADIGITGPDKGQGGKYLLLPPGYKGEVRMATSSCGRRRSASGSPGAVSWSNGDPKPGVDLVKKSTKIYPLSRRPIRRSMKFVDVSGQGSSTRSPRRITRSGSISTRSYRRSRPSR